MDLNLLIGETPYPMIANESLIINELDDVLMNCPLTNMTHKWLKVRKI